MVYTKANVLHFNQKEGRGAKFGRLVACFEEGKSLQCRWHYLFKRLLGEEALRSVWDCLEEGAIQLTEHATGNVAEAYRLALKEGYGVDHFIENVLSSKVEPIDLYYVVNYEMAVEDNPVILTSWDGRYPVMDFYEHLGTHTYPLAEARGIVSRLEGEFSEVYSKGSWVYIPVLGSDLPTVLNYPKDTLVDTDEFIDLLRIAGATGISVSKESSLNGSHDDIGISLTTERGNNMVLTLQDTSSLPMHFKCPCTASVVSEDTVRLMVLSKRWVNPWVSSRLTSVDR